jgi:hypothetical protein
MLKITSDEFTYRGTDYHLRCYIDPTGGEAPVFVVHEPHDNRGEPLPQKRTALAVHLSGQLNLTPDRVKWFEQAPDGSLTSMEFKPFIQEIREYEPDLPLQQMARDERSGWLKPQNAVRYNISERQIDPEPLEKKIGESLPVPETYADRQNYDFERLHSPSNWQYPERSQL